MSDKAPLKTYQLLFSEVRCLYISVNTVVLYRREIIEKKKKEKKSKIIKPQKTVIFNINIQGAESDEYLIVIVC